VRVTTSLPPVSRLSRQCGNLNISQTYRPPMVCYVNSLILKNAVLWDMTPCGSCKRLYVPLKRRFLRRPQGVTSQKTAFFIVIAVKTSYLTYIYFTLSHFTISTALCDTNVPFQINPRNYSSEINQQQKTYPGTENPPSKSRF
jgi:hypothetical protein